MSDRDALTRRYSAYAAKFAADTIKMEPPQTVPPTTGNLANYLARCARSPRHDELEPIRQAFLAEYSGRFTIPRDT